MYRKRARVSRKRSKRSFSKSSGPYHVHKKNVHNTLSRGGRRL